jgi:MFS transporter, ACDE family, multidrug resistance protein
VVARPKADPRAMTTSDGTRNHATQPVHTRAKSSPATLVILLWGSTLTVMAGAILSPVVDVMRRELDVTGTEAGLVVTAHGLSLAVASPLIGRTIDLWGTRGTLAVGLVVYGLAGGAGMLTTSYPTLIASRLVFGIGAAAVFTGTTAALLDLYLGRDRDRVMGWRSSAISLGGVAWPLLGGALGTLSWRAPFGVYLIGIPLGVLSFMALPHRPRTPEIEDAVVGPEGGGKVSVLLYRRAGLLNIYGLQFVSAALLYVILVFLPVRLAEVGIVSPLAVALCTVTLSISMSAIGLAYAPLRARLGHAAMLRTSLMTWTAGLGVLGFANHVAAMTVAAALFGMGMGLAVPTLTVLVGEYAPNNRRGRATSLLATAAFTGQVTSPLVVGPLIEATSVRSGFLAASGLAAGILLTLFALGDQSIDNEHA